MKRKYSSIPFIPLKAKDRNKAVENEIILDTDNNKIYIQKDDTVDLLSGLEERLSNDKEESTEYGITINMKEPDPSNAITYTEYAEGFKPLSIDKENGNCNYGSWKSILENFFGIEPVLINNGEVVCKLDPNNFNKVLDEPFEKQAIYGFEFDMNTGNFEYTDDAIDINRGIEITDNHIEYNGWKEVIFNLIGIKPVTFKDKEISDIDPYDYSKIVSQSNISDDNVMIRFKHLYYYMNITSDKITFKIASYKVDDDYIDDIFGEDGVFYVSAYNASEDINGNLVSKSGTTAKSDHSDGYYTKDILDKYLYILFLGMLIGDEPTLSTLGFGKSEFSTKNNGTMDKSGLFGSTNKATKLFGAENLLGNKVEFNNSIYADGTVLKYNISDDEPKPEEPGSGAESGSENTDLNTQSEENVELDNIIIKRVIKIESNDLAYNDINNMTFCAGSDGIILFIKVPVRIFA